MADKYKILRGLLKNQIVTQYKINIKNIFGHIRNLTNGSALKFRIIKIKIWISKTIVKKVDKPKIHRYSNL